MVDYDVLIIGAGPIGSTFAFHMAEAGYKVGILEKKNKIGVPLQCAGLLGNKIIGLNSVPDEYIINQVRGAYLHSPSDNILKVSKSETQAYVIDRVGYDNYLTQTAQNAGAELFLQHKVIGVENSTGKVSMAKEVQKDFNAKIIVDCAGYSSPISRSINKFSEPFQAAQYLLKLKNESLEKDFVDVYVEDTISPGFIWSIPLTKNQCRIGVFGYQDYHFLNRFLKDFIESNPKFRESNIIKKYHGKIPVYSSHHRLVEGRTIILGDAASQVKPSTGGGLLIGFQSAKIAANIVIRALETEDYSLLQEYEIQFRNLFEKELKLQLFVQKTFQALKNSDLDLMFDKLKTKNAEELISIYGDMDTQSPLIKEMFKRGILFSILPQLLYRRMSPAWNFF